MNESLTSNCSIVSGFILKRNIFLFKNDLDILNVHLISD